MITVSSLLLVTAFVCAIANAVGKCPLWISVILLCLAGLLGVLPR